MGWSLFGKPAETPAQRQQREYRELVEKTQKEANEARAKGLVPYMEEVQESYVGGQHNGNYVGKGYRKIYITPEELAVREQRNKNKNRQVGGKRPTKKRNRLTKKRKTRRS